MDTGSPKYVENQYDPENDLPSPPPQYSTVIVEETFMNYGPNSVTAFCIHCRQLIITRVKNVPNAKTHIYAGLLCILICWPCVILPYFINSCQNREHYCPNCGAYLGTHTI